jgi:hypothetical protein
MTSLTGPSGSAVTGAWVTDGLTFYLVDQAGSVEASATAHVACGGTPRTIDQGLAGGSYFPLAVGNTWVYRYNARFITSVYVIWSITGTQVIGGETYYVLTDTTFSPASTVALLRGGDNGVIYRYAAGGDVIYLDPTNTPPAAYAGPLGSFRDAIYPPAAISGGLLKTSLIYVRGLGLASSQSTMLTGSSGGFTDGLDLIDVRVDGIHLSVPAPKIALAIENTDLDLTNKIAPNCAVPCYFAACGIAPGADPPGTYRPCAQARIDTSTATAGYTVLLELLNSGGTPVYQASRQVASSSDLDYIQLQLYTGNVPALVPFPPGDYTLLAKILNGTSAQATSSLTVHIH